MFTGYQMYEPKTEIDFKVSKIYRFNQIRKFKWEEMGFTFDLKADLSSLFNWNIKQVFLFLSVEFNNDTKTRQQSEYIVWDTIIPIEYKKKYKLNLKDQRVKYILRDVYNKLRGQNVTFTFKAEIMPFVGYYFRQNLASFNYVFPQEYI